MFYILMTNLHKDKKISQKVATKGTQTTNNKPMLEHVGIVGWPKTKFRLGLLLNERKCI